MHAPASGVPCVGAWPRCMVHATCHNMQHATNMHRCCVSQSCCRCGASEGGTAHSGQEAPRFWTKQRLQQVLCTMTPWLHVYGHGGACTSPTLPLAKATWSVSCAAAALTACNPLELVGRHPLGRLARQRRRVALYQPALGRCRQGQRLVVAGRPDAGRHAPQRPTADTAVTGPAYQTARAS